MSETRAEALRRQRAWAATAGLRVDSAGYVSRVADNLRQPLSDAAERAFKAGAGGELSDREDAAAKMVMQNTLENLLVENTGFAFFYNGIHTDALQVRKYLEFMLDHYESKKYVWFQTSADGRAMLGTKPTATDLRNHIKADDIVVTLNDCIRLIADRQHEMEVVRDGFNVRGYNLKTITDIRVAKLEEVWIDGTRETNNS